MGAALAEATPVVDRLDPSCRYQARNSIAHALIKAKKYANALEVVDATNEPVIRLIVAEKTRDPKLFSSLINELDRSRRESENELNFLNISQALIRARFYSEAEELSKNIHSPLNRAAALFELGKEKKNSQLLELAFAVAESAGDVAAVGIQTNCVDGLINLGEVQKALVFTRRISNPSHRASLLAQLGRSLNDQALFKEAIQAAEIVRQQEGDWSAVMSLMEIAEIKRDRQLFLQLLEQLRSKDLPGNFYNMTGGAMLGAGFVDLAMETVERTPDSFYRSALWYQIAVKTKDLSLMMKAVQSAKEVKEAHLVWERLQDLATLMAETGNRKEALETANEISDPRTLATTLSAIAKEMKDKSLFQRAIHAAHRIEDPVSRRGCLGVIAKHQIESQFIEDGLEITNLIHEVTARTQALWAIGELICR